MNRRVFNEFLANSQLGTRLTAVQFLGGWVALQSPMLFLLCGIIIDILASGENPPQSKYGRLVPNCRQFFPQETSPLAQIVVVLAIGAVLLALQAWCLLLFYRRIQSAAVEFETHLIQRIRKHSNQQNCYNGLAGQEQALVDVLEYHIPRVRNSLSRWWRAYPRHLIQLASCSLLAFLLEPTLMMLTGVASGLVVVVYRFFDQRRRTQLPVVRERAAQRRSSLLTLCVRGPLLETVHSADDIQRRFDQELLSYRSDAERSLASSAWKTPLVVLLAGGFTCLFVFIVAVNILRPEAALTLAGMITFLLCCVGATASLVRWERSLRELKSVQTAADDIRRFLDSPAVTHQPTESRWLTQITRSVELDHVTLRDSQGKKLLEDVSVHFLPGKLTGIVSSQRLQASALAELLIGFGRPNSGRMLLDDTLISDIDPKAILSLATWVSASGPLICATIEENLQFDGCKLAQEKLVQALNDARALEDVQKLPDGLSTLVSDGDDRLILDTPFRLGIARAHLLARSIAVLDEPRTVVEPRIEQETTDAMRSLLACKMIAVVLPQRLTTLRNCDTLVLLHEHKVADIGSHTELLQRSELYRHLNYVRFSPLRHVTV